MIDDFFTRKLERTTDRLNSGSAQDNDLTSTINTSNIMHNQIDSALATSRSKYNIMNLGDRNQQIYIKYNNSIYSITINWFNDILEQIRLRMHTIIKPEYIGLYYVSDNGRNIPILNQHLIDFVNDDAFLQDRMLFRMVDLSINQPSSIKFSLWLNNARHVVSINSSYTGPKGLISGVDLINSISYLIMSDNCKIYYNHKKKLRPIVPTQLYNCDQPLHILGRDVVLFSVLYENPQAWLSNNTINKSHSAPHSSNKKKQKHMGKRYSFNIPQSDVSVYDEDQVIMIERLTMSLIGLMTSNSLWNMIIALGHLWTALRPKSSFFYTAAKLIPIIIKLVDINTPQSDKRFSATDLINNYSEVKNTKFFREMYFLMCTTFAIAMTDKEPSMTFAKKMKAYGERIINESVDFPVLMAKSMAFLFDRVTQSIASGCWLDILHDDQKHTEWINKCNELFTLSKHYPRLYQHKWSPNQFDLELETCIQYGERMIKHLPTVTGYLIQNYVNKLKDISYTVTTIKHNTKVRHAPFAIEFYSKAGYGKTNLCNIVYYAFCNAHGLPSGMEYLYVRSAKNKHWDGYYPYQHTILLDDVAQDNPNKVIGVESTVSELISIVNPAQFFAPAAAVEDKGKNIVNPDLVLVTTNTKEMHSKHYVSSKDALMRRMNLIVTMTLKEEYEDPVTKRLNVSDQEIAESMSNGILPNYWEFVVQRNVNTPDSEPNIKYKQVCKTDNIERFLNCIIEESCKHRDNQTLVQKYIHSFKNIRVCDICKRLHATCRCDAMRNNCQTCNLAECICNNVTQSIFSWQEPNLDIHRHIPSSHKYILAIKLIMIKWCLFLSTCWESWIITDMKWFAYIGALGSHMATLTLVYYQVFFSSYMFWPFYVASTSAQVCYLLKDQYYMAYNAVSREISTIAALELLQAFERFWNNMFQRFKIPLSIMMFVSFSRITAEGIQFILYIISSVISGQAAQTKVQEIWTKDVHRNMIDYDFSRKAKNYHTLPLDDQQKLISRNVGFVRMEGVKNGKIKTIVNNGIFSPGGYTWIVNKHAIKALGTNEIIMNYVTGNQKGQVFKYSEQLNVDQDFKFIDNSDVCIFDTQAMPKTPDISSLLAQSTKYVDTVHNGYYMKREVDGNITINKLKKIERSSGKKHTDVDDDSMLTAVSTHKTVNGDCGSICITSTESCSIIGIHSIGNILMLDNTVYMSQINKEWFTNVVQSTNIPYGTLSMNEVTRHAPTKFFNNDCIEEVGCYQLGATKYKTSVGDSPIREQLKSFDIKSEFEAPENGGDNKYMVEYNYMNTFRNLNTCFPRSLMKKAILDYVHQVIDGIDKSEFNYIRILSTYEAINGIDGDKHVPSLNKNTSAGFPRSGIKRLYMIEQEDGKYILEPNIQKELDDCDALFKKGITVNYMVSTARKQEPIKPEKNKIGKIRVFTTFPMTYIIICRQVFLMLISFMQKHRFIFEIAIGINCYSLEWQDVLEYLTGDLDNIQARFVAGDFKAYDQTMHSTSLHAVRQVILSLLYHAGWSEKDIRYAYAVFDVLIDKHIKVQNNIFRTCHTNTSGNSLTTIINCIRQSLEMRCIYYMICANQDITITNFSSVCNMITYGDDGVIYVKDGHDYFNHTTIQEMYDHVGITYTMAEKDEVSVPFIPLNRVTFLRRRFEYSSYHECYIAPLDIQSINKALTCWTYSNECPEVQMFGVLNSVFLELFFHGEFIYNKYKSAINEILFKNTVYFKGEELWMDAYFPHGLPTYDKMYNWWKESYFPQTESEETSCLLQ